MSATSSTDPCVLHVIETLGHGGAERLLVTLLPELARQGMRTEVAVLRGPLDLVSDLAAAGIPVHQLPVRYKWALCGTARDLAALAATRGACILHAHLYFPVVITALARRLGLWRGGTAATFHNLAYDGANRKTWKLRMRRCLASVLIRRNIDLPIAVSQAVAVHYRAAYGLGPVEVVYNPVDLVELAGIPVGDDGSVALPGRLVHEKAHLDLIVALSRLPNPPALACLGEGRMRDRIAAAAARAGLVVEITGLLDHHVLLTRVAAARLVVVPSRFEGFGLTALEALALGKPVIASDAGGLPEVLGAAGRIFPHGDVDALVASLSEALTDADWRAAQAAPARAQAQRFALPTVATRQIALYRTLLP